MKHFWYNIEGEPIDLHEADDLIPDIEKRRVAVYDDGEYRVSTIHTVLDTALLDGGPPMIFETMVFDPDRERLFGRYPTKESALKGHQQAVELAKEEARRRRR